MIQKVDFLIIGTQKAGTTSLFHYLKQHDDIYLSEVKEVNYFVLDHLYERGEKYYHSFFNRHKSEKVTGSAYVHMLPCAKCPERVKIYNSAMKFIVVLREPVERAYSAFNYAKRNGWEDRDTTFSEAIALENDRIAAEKYDLTYFYNGLYYQHLSRWMKFFPEKQFLILTLDDLQNHGEASLNRIFDFLRVERKPVDASKKFNEASEVHSRKLQKIMLDKESRLNRMIGKLMGRQLKVYLRSRIFPLIYSFNTKSQSEILPELSADDLQKVKPLFSEDLRNLRNKFNIEFNNNRNETS